MNLSAEFQKHVGIIIKDPERMSTDSDTAAGVRLNDHAHAKGLTVQFIKEGDLSTGDHDTSRLRVHIKKDPKTAWGWKVQQLQIG